MNKAKQKAKELLEKMGVKLPINVEEAAEILGIRVEKRDMKDEISGMLVMENDSAIIAINSNHHANRQRFSVAHEIGHFLLHYKTAGVYVDASPLFFRDKAGMGTQKEIEANAFAAELLMPEEAITELVSKIDREVFDEETAQQMADKFKVSKDALIIRMMKLKFIHS